MAVMDGAADVEMDHADASVNADDGVSSDDDDMDAGSVDLAADKLSDMDSDDDEEDNQGASVGRTHAAGGDDDPTPQEQLVDPCVARTRHDGACNRLLTRILRWLLCAWI